MAHYDTFIAQPGALPEDQEILLPVRDLTPGTHKYQYKYVRCIVSSNPEVHPQQLAIRYGRGQLAPETYSIRVIEEVQRVPAKYR